MNATSLPVGSITLTPGRFGLGGRLGLGLRGGGGFLGDKADSYRGSLGTAVVRVFDQYGTIW